jgi:hypothetical protein
MEDVPDLYFPEADVIRIVLDNLNTHTPAALYEAFAPAEARRIMGSLAHHLPFGAPRTQLWSGESLLELLAF